MGQITLDTMRFYACHGVYKEEQTTGAWFEVSVTLDVDFGNSPETDLLDDTLNYEEVYAAVREQMQVVSKLLEHVANRILNVLLSQFHQIKAAEVRLSKLNPPLGGEVKKVTVTLCRERRS